MIVTIALGLCLGLIALGVLAMLVSGIRSTINGKQDFKKIATMLAPFIVFAIAFVIAGKLVEAAIATMLFMLAVMVLAIIASGLRSTFT